MIQFRAYIRVEGENLEFVFTRLYTVRGEIFYVVVDKIGYSIYSFTMAKPDGVWKLDDAAPDWLKPIEKNLSEAISNNYPQK